MIGRQHFQGKQLEQVILVSDSRFLHYVYISSTERMKIDAFK